MSYGDYAHQYLRSGWAPLPGIPKTKKPLVAGWHGHDAPWPSGADVQAWIEDHPRAETLIRVPEGVIGLDFDDREVLDGMTSMYGPLPDGPQSSNRWGTEPWRAIHFLRVPIDRGFKSPFSGLDLILNHLRVAAVFPSIHISGRPYEWRNNQIPQVDDLPWLPEVWYPALQAPERPPVAPGEFVGTIDEASALLRYVEHLKAAHDAGPGERNNRLNKSAFKIGQLVGWWLTTEKATDDLLSAASVYVKNHGTNAAKGTIRSGLEAGMKQPLQVLGEIRIGGKTMDEWSEQAEVVPPKGDGTPDDKPSLWDEFKSPEELYAMPDGEWLIRDWLELDSTAAVIGKSGHMKSFVSIDMACHVAMGMPWHGHEVKQGLVLYVAAEGEKGIKKRIKAWELHYGIRPDNLRVITRPILAKSAEWDEFVKIVAVHKPVLAIVDTQARATVGMEENSATEMGAFIYRMDQLRRASGCCAFVVHHIGKDADKGGRGSTSLYAAWTTEITAVKDDSGVVRLTTSKEKDADDSREMTFTPLVIETGEDDQGYPITSLVLTRENVPAPQEIEVDMAMRARMDLLDIINSLFPVNEDVLRTELRRLITDRGYGRTVAYQAIKWYVDEGHLELVGNSRLKLVTPRDDLVQAILSQGRPEDQQAADEGL